MAKKVKTAAPAHKNESRDLVYRLIEHQPEVMVFAPRSTAFHVHQIWQAIRSAKTWGEFESMIAPGEWEFLLNRFDEVPAATEHFDSVRLPGYSDGDYPTWLQATMEGYLPLEVLMEFGVREETMLNGDFWGIPAANEPLLLTRLKSLGYSVERKDDWYFF